MSRLRRVDCSSTGFRRRRAGKGFVYHDDQGRRVTDREVLERIRSLTIPPAWTEVWICPWPMGHIQAVGTDARGRRQYLYHSLWSVRRQTEKFDRMVEFARVLPDLRARCSELLAEPTLSRERVLACAVRLLDVGFFRVGGERYAQDNQSYGLATLRKEHVRLGPDHTVTFEYMAKSGKQRLHSIVDDDVFAAVQRLKRRRGGGPNLFAFRAPGGDWVGIRSTHINAFVKEMSGGEFTAKDFRTWAATVLAAVALAVAEGAQTGTARKRAVSRAFQEVAHYLGNTPAVCRSSYVDPRVVDRYLGGVTIATELGALAEDPGPGRLVIQGAIEEAVLDLLDESPSPGALRAS